MEAVGGQSLPKLDEGSLLKQATERIAGLLKQAGDSRIAAVRQQVQDCMTTHCGVYRSEALLREGT